MKTQTASRKINYKMFLAQDRNKKSTEAVHHELKTQQNFTTSIQDSWTICTYVHVGCLHNQLILDLGQNVPIFHSDSRNYLTMESYFWLSYDISYIVSIFAILNLLWWKTNSPLTNCPYQHSYKIIWSFN